MLGHYTASFRAARPEAAADYIILICLNADLPGEIGGQQRQLCYEGLRELVLETREFAQLLGDIRADGQRIKGAIEQRLPLIKLENQAEFLRTVTVQAAAAADSAGRTTDAVLLYHLADEHDSVVTILCQALSDSIAVDIGQEPLKIEPLRPREDAAAQQQGQAQQQQNQLSSLSLTASDDPVQLARNMVSLYNSNGLFMRGITPHNRDLVALLLQVASAKSLVASSQWANAFDHINALSLLPVRASGEISIIRTFASNFNQLDPLVARNVGSLLLWTVECCRRQREEMVQGGWVDETRRRIGEELGQAVRDLMVFAGLVRYKLPPRVFEVLARVGGEL